MLLEQIPIELDKRQLTGGRSGAHAVGQSADSVAKQDATIRREVQAQLSAVERDLDQRL
jgi:hypothetical protein